MSLLSGLNAVNTYTCIDTWEANNQLLVLHIKKKYLEEPGNVISSFHGENPQLVQAEMGSEISLCLTPTSPDCDSTVVSD